MAAIRHDKATGRIIAEADVTAPASADREVQAFTLPWRSAIDVFADTSRVDVSDLHARLYALINGRRYLVRESPLWTLAPNGRVLTWRGAAESFDVSLVRKGPEDVALSALPGISASVPMAAIAWGFDPTPNEGEQDGYGALAPLWAFEAGLSDDQRRHPFLYTTASTHLVSRGPGYLRRASVVVVSGAPTYVQFWDAVEAAFPAAPMGNAATSRLLASYRVAADHDAISIDYSDGHRLGLGNDGKRFDSALWCVTASTAYGANVADLDVTTRTIDCEVRF